MRNDVLDCAKKAINGPREETYGSPYENHKRIADIWSAMTGHTITPSMVAAMMIGVKISRASHQATHIDNWVDIAGYSALAWEIQSEEHRAQAKKDLAEVPQGKCQEETGESAPPLYEDDRT